MHAGKRTNEDLDPVVYRTERQIRSLTLAFNASTVKLGVKYADKLPEPGHTLRPAKVDLRTWDHLRELPISAEDTGIVSMNKWPVFAPREVRKFFSALLFPNLVCCVIYHCDWAT
jgi:hypothetical protein